MDVKNIQTSFHYFFIHPHCLRFIGTTLVHTYIHTHPVKFCMHMYSMYYTYYGFLRPMENVFRHPIEAEVQGPYTVLRDIHVCVYTLTHTHAYTYIQIHTHLRTHMIS